MPYTIRPTQPDDAAGIIALLSAVAHDPINNLGRDKDESMFTEEWERDFLTRQAARPDWLGLVAIGDDGAVVGSLTLDAKQRLGMRHCADVGLCVRADYRGLGVGRALMERAIAWARETGTITRIELDVFARNTLAIGLYERLGFQHEGRHLRAFYREGEYLDSLSMGLLLS